MSVAQPHEPVPQNRLRLWPGVLLAVLLVLARFALPMPYAALGGMAGGVIIVIWWAFFSRAPHLERWGAIGLMIVAALVTSRLIHPSIATGMMGFMFPMYAIPVLSVALVVWAVATQRFSAGPRRLTMVAAILLVCVGFALIRTGGMTGDAVSDLAWRWTPTPEERLLAHASDNPAPIPAAPAVTASAKIPAEPVVARAGSESTLPDPAPVSAKAGAKSPSLPEFDSEPAIWPGFRGPHRDSNIPGVRIETDWIAAPPVQIWRRPIGPGWSSFSVRGDLIYTQEQRGNDEIVACYRLSTGAPVWKHADAARFWESNGGAGPRGTPTLDRGRAYTFGATGIVNALDARSGAVVWSRNASSDTGAKLPGWGFTSSPLVVDNVVIVAASGRLVAYELATGNQRWTVQSGGGSYASPQLFTIGGVPQVLLLNGSGAISVAPADGKILWKHAWAGDTILQPTMTADGAVLISTSGTGGVGTRRLAVTQGAGGWTADEVWTSTGLKPYFNDLVVHKGYAYGFDGNILACIDLKDGKRVWKGGRYGSGQLVLLSDEDVLLVLSEEGGLALVSATPDQYKELAKVPAIEGKTWNHPVLVGDTLLVRNGEEMAAFRLTLRR